MGGVKKFRKLVRGQLWGYIINVFRQGRTPAVDDFFISIPISERKSICVSSVTAAELAAAEIKHLGNDFGLFAYESSIDDPASIEIIAKFASREAAEKMVVMLELAFRSSGINRSVERHCTSAEWA
jgi:hypothetical protein